MLGAHHIDLTVNEPNRRVYDCDRIALHPEFVPLHLSADIALIELPSNVNINGERLDL